MKYTLIIIIFILTSCNKGSNKTEQEVETDTIVELEKYLRESDSLQKAIIEEKIINSDTLNRIKAFDNIYFRTTNNDFKDEYLLDNIPFGVKSSTYYNDLLYDFELRTLKIRGIDYEYKNQTMSRLISIIKLKYKNPKKINKFIKSELTDEIFLDEESNIPKPKDNNNLHINYEWKKGDIRVRLGYKIFYKKSENYQQNKGYYRKMFIPVLEFRDLKIAKEANKDRQERDIQEIKNDSEKF